MLDWIYQTNNKAEGKMCDAIPASGLFRMLCVSDLLIWQGFPSDISSCKVGKIQKIEP
jgi:hypothetical protein